MLMPGRGYNSAEYRWGFNGKETDNETNWQDYGFRIYYPGLGKFLSVDPLFKSYPWYTPYQFAGNTPISCIDLDGLEMYFAADGSFLGQSKHGGSEIRVATSYTLHNETTKRSGKNGWYEITKSQPLSQFDVATAGKVYKTIYDKEIKGKSNVLAERNSSNTLGGHTKKNEGPIVMNLNNAYGDEYLNTDYNNVVNTLYHENQHFGGTGSSGFEHFNIWDKQTSHSSYDKTTENMKAYLRESGSDYISHMERNLQEMLHKKDSKNESEKSYKINYYFEAYKNNVSIYNKKTGSNYKPETLKDLKSFKSNKVK
jgi:RHS repeat-associated protein